MIDILNGILILLAVVAFIFAFRLIMQFLSKISGKSFRAKGSRLIVNRPTDFDESVQDIKAAVSKIDDSIKMLGLDSHGRLIYRFEKILKLLPELKLSDYISLINQHNELSEQLKQAKIKDEYRVTPTANGEWKDLHFYDSDNSKKIDSYKHQLIGIEIRLRPFGELFKNKEIEKIELFFTDYIKSEKSKLIKLIDSIGCENLKSFCDEIDNLEKTFVAGKITKESINKIKLLILKQKGLILSVIV